jgi:hypothetical protein
VNVKFHRLLPESLDYIPQKITQFLQKAVTESPTSDLAIADAIAYARIGQGDIYAVMLDDKLTGSVFYLYGQGNNGRILDVALLGGERFMQWRKQAYDFTVTLAKHKECKEIWVMGREGWGKIFPDMEAIGVVYRLVIA